MFVGDDNQSIYGWRGASGALAQVKTTFPDSPNFPLTKSFRFGPAIAFVANAWLWGQKLEAKHLLTGIRKVTVPFLLSIESWLRLKEGGLDEAWTEGEPIHIICRTNMTILKEAFQIAAASPPDQPTPIEIHSSKELGELHPPLPQTQGMACPGDLF